MRTDLPLHSKNANRARHLEEINVSRIQMSNLSSAILQVICQNMTKKEMIKLFFLLKSGHDIVFEKKQTASRQMSLFGPEIFLPAELKKILETIYPEKKREERDL